MERNGVERKIELKQGKLICECQDAVFTGVPCRHSVMIVNSQTDLRFDNLTWNRRWKIDHYAETRPQISPSSTSVRENREEEKTNETLLQRVSFILFTFDKKN